MKHSEKGAVLITGGAVRLGRAMALHLAASGYDIALHYHSSQQEARDTATEIRERGVLCEEMQFSFGADRSPEDLIKESLLAMPHLNGLLNNASVYQAAPIASTDVELLRRQFEVNFITPFLLTAAFARLLGRGAVVNILDNKIYFNQNEYAAYLLSKKSLAEFTRMAALEFAPGVRVNGVAPGVVLPAEKRSNEYVSWRVAGIPLARQGTTEDISRLVLFFLENEFVTGQILAVDGGESITTSGRNTGSYRGEANVCE